MTIAPDTVRTGTRVVEAPVSLETEPSVITALSTLVRRWRLVVGLPLLGATVTLAVSLIWPATYTATTTFVPEVRSQTRLPASVASLAGQMGLSLGSEPGQSPQFYADVLRSRGLLERILLARYPQSRPNTGATDSTTLLLFLDVGGKNPADSLARAVKKLNKLIAVRPDVRTNIVQVSVDARSPIIAAAVANRLIEYLNEFNTQQRQSQARERRKFTEQRVVAADSDLRRSEDAVRTFYERNRGWQQAPELVFEEGRLRRQVTISQEVYLTLKREYETSRIEEVNDTPVITVIDPAVPPPRRSSPKRILVTIVAFLACGVLAALGAFGSDYVDKLRRDQDDDYRELTGVLRNARRELRQAVSRLVQRRPAP